jgi:hypothetical protein
MRAYIDESGHESMGWMFLAGYLGNEDQWGKFVERVDGWSWATEKVSPHDRLALE